MAVNPFKLLQLKDRFKIFQENHPKLIPFFKACESMVRPGTVIEITFRSPEGDKKTANLKLTEEDIKTFQMIRNQK